MSDVNWFTAPLPDQKETFKMTTEHGALQADSVDALLIGNEWLSVEPGSIHLVPSAWAADGEIHTPHATDRKAIRFMPAGEKHQLTVSWSAIQAVKHRA